MKGCGLLIFADFIRPLCIEVAETIAVKDLNIFALPIDDLIKTYEEKYHFKRVDPENEEQLHARLKPKYDNSCIFMFQTLHGE